MFPIKPVYDPTDVTLVGSKAVADSLQGEVGSLAQLTNGSDIGFGEPRVPILAALISPPMANSIGRILLWRYPAKVAGAIIKAITVPVGYMVANRRALAMECSADQHMHGCSVSGAGAISSEKHAIVASSQHGSQDDPRIKASSSYAVAVGDPAIQRPHTPKTRRLVVRMTRNWTPLFHVLDGRCSLRYAQGRITLLVSRV